MKNVRIVEATIRDGGYMVDHHYSRTDLATLVGGLDGSGLPFIEVGHGNGVGSQFFRDPKIRGTVLPVVGDEDHAAVALRVARRARVGVILTAGKRFAPIDYIDRIADLGFAFIRLAAMPDEVDDELFAYVRRVKDRGLIASINMMQTYAKTPDEVGELAKRAGDHGLDWFYVVDSGGGMMVDDVKRYVTAIREASRVEVGLHAHNNLGCAVANCLAAVDAGATLVDGTLNGIGRATGNPATEQLAVALRDRLADDIDLDALLSLGTAVRSLFQDAGNDPLDFVSGGALVHSRNVPKVIEAARQRDRSPCSFLLGVGVEARRRGTINAMSYSEDLFDAVAETTSALRPVAPSTEVVDVAAEEILARWNGSPKDAIEALSLRSRQRHVASVLHVSRAASKLCARPVPWQSSVMGLTIPIAEHAGSWEVEPSRRPDYIFVDDGDPEPPIEANIARWRISFAELCTRAAADLRTALANLGTAAVLLADDGSNDGELVAGGIGIVMATPARARVEAIRKRGARVVQPSWTRAIAHAAETLISLHHELSSADPGNGLVTGVAVCGAGQASWDPERALLLDADDPVAAAKKAAAVYVNEIFRGARRL